MTQTQAVMCKSIASIDHNKTQSTAGKHLEERLKFMCQTTAAGEVCWGILSGL